MTMSEVCQIKLTHKANEAEEDIIELSDED